MKSTKQTEAGRYVVKCDSCKQDIRRTDDITEAYQGGTCPDCRTGR